MADGGQAAVDTLLIDLWNFANGRTLPEIIANFQGGTAAPDIVRAGLACLVEAGLLLR